MKVILLRIPPKHNPAEDNNQEDHDNILIAENGSAKGQETHADLDLGFSKLKIVWRMVNNEMSTLQIFRILDQDNSNSLEPLEILNGLKNYLHVYLSREETNKLRAHLDEDGSGDIDFHKFDQKVSITKTPLLAFCLFSYLMVS
jgi:hypothetical protein